MHLYLAVFFAFFLPFHDFHVTHTTLFYNEAAASIEVTIKVAIEDLELALEDMWVKDLNIGTSREDTTTDQQISNYFKRHLKILLNETPMSYSWVGKEISADMHDSYIYFELADCNQGGKIKSLVVENNIFTHVIPDQSNIVLIEFGEQKHNLTFTKTRNRQKVVLD